MISFVFVCMLFFVVLKGKNLVKRLQNLTTIEVLTCLHHLDIFIWRQWSPCFLTLLGKADTPSSTLLILRPCVPMWIVFGSQNLTLVHHCCHKSQSYQISKPKKFLFRKRKWMLLVSQIYLLLLFCSIEYFWFREVNSYTWREAFHYIVRETQILDSTFVGRCNWLLVCRCWHQWYSLELYFLLQFCLMLLLQYCVNAFTQT